MEELGSRACLFSCLWRDLIRAAVQQLPAQEPISEGTAWAVPSAQRAVGTKLGAEQGWADSAWSAMAQEMQHHQVVAVRSWSDVCGHGPHCSYWSTSSTHHRLDHTWTPAKCVCKAWGVKQGFGGAVLWGHQQLFSVPIPTVIAHISLALPDSGSRGLVRQGR